jgi:cysteine desulfurase/selenocysteine lyase
MTAHNDAEETAFSTSSDASHEEGRRLEREIQRLAREFFSDATWLSPALGFPPVPAAVKEPPIASGPPPTPYFLDIAGVEKAPGSSSPATFAPTGEYTPELVPEGLRSEPRPFDAHAIKRDFPILGERIHGRKLVWLDNAATTQKPRAVIDRLVTFYERENSNVHRAAHTLASRATDALEGARETAGRFVNASSSKEIVFVRGATEAINLVAQSWGRRQIGAGDEIVVTWLEHHANIVPWQQLCGQTGARLRVAPVDSRGQVILEEYERLLGPRTRIVSLAHVSNALGTVLPVRTMVDIAHRYGAVTLVDGAQAVSHMPVDVQALDCDFYVFSGHKVFGPTGIGVLFGKTAILEHMPPWQGGGNVIADVTFERTVYQSPPNRFEAGTANIAGAAGLATALDYVTAIGMSTIERYERELIAYSHEQLARVPGLTMIGTAAEKAGVLSFVLDGVRTQDVGALLDQEGIAVRAGHHCAQPIHRRFGLESTVRASLALYNTREDIDALVAALLRLRR